MVSDDEIGKAGGQRSPSRFQGRWNGRAPISSSASWYRSERLRDSRPREIDPHAPDEDAGGLIRPGTVAPDTRSRQIEQSLIDLMTPRTTPYLRRSARTVSRPGGDLMAFSKGGMSAICAAISLIALSAPARAEVLFDSLSSPNSGVMGGGPFRFQDDASFATGAPTFHATDIALLLNRDGTDMTASGDTFTVSLEGGVPLADVTFPGPNLGLNIPGGSLLGSVTLPISVLSTNLTAEHFTQFANIALKPNSFYWIDLGVSLGPRADCIWVAPRSSLRAKRSNPGEQ